MQSNTRQPLETHAATDFVKAISPVKYSAFAQTEYIVKKSNINNIISTNISYEYKLGQSNFFFFFLLNFF